MSSALKNKAPGTFNRDSANRIKGVFVIDGYEYAFGASLNPSLPPFTSKTAWIHYDSVDDLTGTHSYKGYIGTSSFLITFDNGVYIDGDLNVPYLENKNQIDGSGIWSQS